MQRAHQAVCQQAGSSDLARLPSTQLLTHTLTGRPGPPPRCVARLPPALVPTLPLPVRLPVRTPSAVISQSMTLEALARPVRCAALIGFARPFLLPAPSSSASSSPSSSPSPSSPELALPSLSSACCCRPGASLIHSEAAGLGSRITCRRLGGSCTRQGRPGGRGGTDVAANTMPEQDGWQPNKNASLSAASEQAKLHHQSTN